MNMTLRTKLLAVSATAILLATSTLAQARSTDTSHFACAAVSGLETLCELRGIAQTLTPLRDAVDAKTMLRGLSLVKAQWIWRVLRDM
jgi:hypothetical protein